MEQKDVPSEEREKEPHNNGEDREHVTDEDSPPTPPASPPNPQWAENPPSSAVPTDPPLKVPTPQVVVFNATISEEVPRFTPDSKGRICPRCSHQYTRIRQLHKAPERTSWYCQCGQAKQSCLKCPVCQDILLANEPMGKRFKAWDRQKEGPFCDCPLCNCNCGPEQSWTASKMNEEHIKKTRLAHMLEETEQRPKKRARRSTKEKAAKEIPTAVVPLESLPQSPKPMTEEELKAAREGDPQYAMALRVVSPQGSNSPGYYPVQLHPYSFMTSPSPERVKLRGELLRLLSKSQTMEILAPEPFYNWIVTKVVDQDENTLSLYQEFKDDFPTFCRFLRIKYDSIQQQPKEQS